MSEQNRSAGAAAPPESDETANKPEFPYVRNVQPGSRMGSLEFLYCLPNGNFVGAIDFRSTEPKVLEAMAEDLLDWARRANKAHEEIEAQRRQQQASGQGPKIARADATALGRLPPRRQ